PRRGMPPSPHRSGRVMSQQAWEALGQAPMFLEDWQVPQAPVPGLPQGPQEEPQQNQVVSPAQMWLVLQAMWCSLRGGDLVMTGREWRDCSAVGGRSLLTVLLSASVRQGENRTCAGRGIWGCSRWSTGRRAVAVALLRRPHLGAHALHPAAERL